MQTNYAQFIPDLKQIITVIFIDSSKNGELASRDKSDDKNVIFIDVSKVNISDYDSLYNTIVSELTHDNTINPYVRDKKEGDVKTGSTDANLEEEYTQLGNYNDNSTSYYETYLQGTDVLNVGNEIYSNIDPGNLQYSSPGAGLSALITKRKTQIDILKSYGIKYDKNTTIASCSAEDENKWTCEVAVLKIQELDEKIEKEKLALEKEINMELRK